jgi:signal transduction histidine kinase
MIPVQTDPTHSVGCMLQATPRPRLQHHEAIASLSIEALAGRPLERLIRHALDASATCVDVPVVTLMELTPSRAALRLRAAAGLAEGADLRCPANATTVFGRCLISRRPVMVRDWEQPRFEPPPALREAGVRSTLAVPVEAGEWQGVLAAHSTVPRRFSRESIRMLGEIIRVLAAGLRRAELEEQVSVRTQQHVALAELGRLTLSDAPAGQVLDQAGTLVAAAMSATVVTVSGRDPDGRLRVRAVYPQHLNVESWPLEGGATVVGDWAQAGGAPPGLADESVRCSLAASAGVHGVLAVHSRRPHRYDSGDARLVEAFASMLAGAVARSNSQLASRDGQSAIQPGGVAARPAPAAGAPARPAVGEGEARRRRAMASVLRAGEEERVRIASELHDDTVQEMAAILITLDRVVDAARRGDPEAATRSAVQARATLATTTERARRLLFELRPPLLDAGGLGPAVRQAAETAGRAGGFEVHAQTDVGRHPQAVEALVYRVMCELIENATAHSGGHRLDVQLALRDEELHGKVEDDGAGFDIERVLGAGQAAPSRLGAMRERIALSGGRLDIHSRPGSGTTARLRVPTV